MSIATAPAQTAQLYPSSSTSCLLLPSDRRFELHSLDIQQDSTEAIFLARHDSLVTSHFVGFEQELLRYLPELLDNVQCHNGCDHDFATEMTATETGHLFEHVWLEVLCCEKLRTAEVAAYSGETTWNWHVDPIGLFHVTISAGVAEKELIERSAFISSLILERSLI